MAIEVPLWSAAENRGTQLYDTCTGSTQDIPVAYERDLKGCGTPEYTFFRMSESINNIIDCVTTPVFGLSISGFFRQDTNSQATFTGEMTEMETRILAQITALGLGNT